MGLLQLVRVNLGEVGILPGTVKMVTTDSLATITAAGYLNGVSNQLAIVKLSPGDVVECLYSFNASSGTGDYSVFKVSITNGLVTLVNVAPAGAVKFMGQLTSVGGGGATEAYVVTGAIAATDRAFVQVVNNGTNNVTVLEAVVTANTLTITFSGDPAADTIINYQLLRAAS